MTESTSSNSVCNASKIADFFVTEFYSRLKKDPSTLYELYHDSGYLTWVGSRVDISMDENCNPQSVIRAETKEKIRSAINLLDLGNCTTYVEVLECSKSINNSLFITAKGRMYIGEGESVGRGFVQNFLLTEIRPRWYFVRNDCLMFLDSELPLRKSIHTAAKMAGCDPGLCRNNGKKLQNELQTEVIRSPREQVPVHKAACSEEQDKNDEKQIVRTCLETEACKSDENKDSDLVPENSVSGNREEFQQKAIASASSNTSPANYSDSLNAKNNANINRASPQKYEVTSYAGKLMGGTFKGGSKGHAAPAEDDKSKVHSHNNGSVKKSNNTQKDAKSMRDIKNKRKIFVHSLPSNISDDQIREAVLNQLKVHGGGYVVDVERARVTGRHWGIIELDSEFSCRTLLNNGLYLGGAEVSIEKWRQMQSSHGQNASQYPSKVNKHSNRPNQNHYHNSGQSGNKQ
ncbi:nuclear transport factor 2 domain-containing protein [Cryptosporidium felis]|nr:nuclear transport factor 2 domain-containing protein [Cryptosporidium felis]